MAAIADLDSLQSEVDRGLLALPNLITHLRSYALLPWVHEK